MLWCVKRRRFCVRNSWVLDVTVPGGNALCWGVEPMTLPAIAPGGFFFFAACGKKIFFAGLIPCGYKCYYCYDNMLVVLLSILIDTVYAVI